MSDEWGPWVEHDGKGCPCVGRWVQGVRANGDEFEGIAGTMSYACFTDYPRSAHTGNWWIWKYKTPTFGDVVKYRIRKPRGLIILESILREVEREPETV